MYKVGMACEYGGCVVVKLRCIELRNFCKYREALAKNRFKIKIQKKGIYLVYLIITDFEFID